MCISAAAIKTQNWEFWQRLNRDRMEAEVSPPSKPVKKAKIKFHEYKLKIINF